MIEIQRPELEALIQERMMSGAYHDVEDVLIQALRSSPLPESETAGHENKDQVAMGTKLLAAMQASPFKEICLEPRSEPSPVRDVAF